MSMRKVLLTAVSLVMLLLTLTGGPGGNASGISPYNQVPVTLKAPRIRHLRSRLPHPPVELARELVPVLTAASTTLSAELAASTPFPVETHFFAASPTTDTQLGWSIALSGNTALVGAYREDLPNQPDAGAVYVFVHNGTEWAQQARLIASDSQAASQFGFAVALDGDTAVIGTIGDDAQSTNAGAAYIFTRTGTTWTQQQKLIASDAGTYHQFGYAVAVSGNTALIGAPFATINGFPYGAAYSFTRTGTTWSQQQKLVASDPEINDSFGWSVALYGTTALIGAPFKLFPGAAYLFAQDGTTWTQQQTLRPDSDNFDQFGSSVALGEQTALIGAPFGNTAYLFERMGNTWAEHTRLVPPDEATDPQFGTAVALHGNMALIGAPFADDSTDPSRTGIGAAYLFRRSDTTWSEEQTLTASDATTDEQFGAAVALGLERALVGAPLKDVHTASSTFRDAGAVSAYQPAVPGTLTIVKEAQPEGDHPFTFTSNIPGNETFTLTDNGHQQNQLSVTLAPGTYTLSETVPNGWALISATCDNGNPVTAVTIASGASVTCTFVNVEDTPTAVTLISFTAEVDAHEQVVLRWETATELNNAGFNLYRATSLDGPWIRLNDTLIAAEGNPVTGASYRFVDTPGSGRFYYRLEDVDFNGTATMHGPLVVRVGADTISAEQHRVYLPAVMQR